MRSNPLDGPGMGYGPAAGSDRRGSPVVTVVLALVCLVLAATLAFVLLRPTGGLTAAPVVTVTATPAASAPSAARAPSTAARSATPSPSVTPSGTDATERADEPEGVRDAVAAFMRAWLEREPDVRIPLLQVSATESLTEKLSDVDPRKVPKAKPVGKPVISAASDYSVVADQKLSNKSTVRMELVYDPASRYGWLVDSVGPLE